MKALSAVTSVLLSLMSIVVLVAAASAFYPHVAEWVGDLFHDEEPKPIEGVLADEKAKDLAAQNLRQQFVTFKEIEPVVLEQGAVFMIGVGQNTVSVPEEKDNKEVHGFTISRDLYDVALQTDKQTASKPNDLSGRFNNILLFNPVTDEVIEIFDRRVMVSHAQPNWADSPTHLLLVAATDDTNDDGVLSGLDDEKLFLYSIAARALVRVDVPNAELNGIFHVSGANYVIVQFRMDRNGDGRFRSSATKTEPEDPLRFMKVSLETGAASDLVPDEIRERLQKRLQGDTP